MKIAVWHNLPSGGGKRALYQHVKGLVERGHYLESWCPPTADQTYLPLSNLIKEHVVSLDQTETLGRIKYVLNVYQGHSERINAMDRHCQQCADEINRGGFDVLFANACTAFRVTAIARYVEIPTVIYLGEPYRWLYEAMPKLPWLALPPATENGTSSLSYARKFLRDLIAVQESRIQAREELRNAQAFDLILVNSLFSRESVQRAYGLDSKVCYLGVDTDFFKPLNLPREDFVIGLGLIYPGKGLERAIQAIATIEKRCRPTLIWVGNAVERQYQKEIEQLALSLGVSFIPKIRIPDQDLITLLNQAVALIYTPKLEPFGLAPLEANACETPVVGIAEGGVRESILHGVNGFLIGGSNPVEMGQAITKLMTEPDLLHEMGKTARKHVLERWNWNSAISNLEDALLEVVKSQGNS